MLDQSLSKVEIKGFAARYYDRIMRWGSLGRYQKFIESAIRKMEIQPDDAILDLGCGTGSNDCLMAQYLGPSGLIVGVDIGEEMVNQFKEKCSGKPNVHLVKQRIEEPLPFENRFDKVLLSFVIHGFAQPNREKIIRNAYQALKTDGQLFILDFNEFDLQDKPFWFRYGFKKVECPLAFEFIALDFKTYLQQWGFGDFKEDYWFMDTLRLLKACKMP